MEDFELECYRKAGKINKQVKDFAFSFIKKDMKLIEIALKIDEKIIELGGEIAFPVNLSINEIAAHYTPSMNDSTIAEGLLKIDVGVEVNGYIADSAFSMDLTEDKHYEKMIRKNSLILNSVISNLEVGSKVCSIGNKISDELENSEFRIIHNLSGHSLAKDEIHSGLTISNHRNKNDTVLNDCAIAIEPFLTTGKGEIYEGNPSGIYLLQGVGKPRDRDARKLLEFIQETYRTKPFCKRWLEQKNFSKLNFSLKILEREGILHNFPVLIERDKQPVSQMEHTVIFHKEVEVTTN